MERVAISYSHEVGRDEEPTFQQIVRLAAKQLADWMTPRILKVSFVAKKACCSCADHVAAEVSYEDNPPFAIVHLPHDRYRRSDTWVNIVIESADTRARQGKRSSEDDYTAEEVALVLCDILIQHTARTIRDLEQIMRHLMVTHASRTAVSLRS